MKSATDVFAQYEFSKDIFLNNEKTKAVRRQLRDLSNKIGPNLQPVFVSRELEQDLKPNEAK